MNSNLETGPPNGPVLLGISVLLAILYLPMVLAHDSVYFGQRLPDYLAVRSPALHGSNGFTGGAVWYLSDDTIKTFEQGGLAFLTKAEAEAKAARKDIPWPQHRARIRNAYTWHETPAPEDWFAVGCPFAPGMSSFPNSLFFNANRILGDVCQALREPGSYYSGRPSNEIIVSPRHGVVIFIYFD